MTITPKEPRNQERPKNKRNWRPRETKYKETGDKERQRPRNTRDQEPKRNLSRETAVTKRNQPKRQSQRKEILK